MQAEQERPAVAVVGAGPAGLMAAEVLAMGGAAVTVLDRMPSPGRKFLMAGRGGLNLTHSEPLEPFLARYGAARPQLEPLIRAFPPSALVAWAEGLGQPCFTGSSGRIFPRALKASPLLRAWLARLAGLGAAFRLRHGWEGWAPEGGLAFATPGGPVVLRPAAAVLALGGASWPRLGADGGWVGKLPGVTPFRPANCGFRIAWSAHLRARFAGTPLKRIALTFRGQAVRGEAVLTETGIEGGAVYALSAPLREAIAAAGPVTALLDLRPDLAAEELARRLDAPRGGVSLANHLRRAGLPPVAAALVQDALRAGATAPLSALVKALPLRLEAPMPIERAISSAGGLGWAALDARLMLRGRPGVFAAGEMLDWEAPTGGYLLQACFATGRAAGQGALDWLATSPPPG
ncbi:TIGR03862 family flavoprotein [Siccirubricoccus sp. KC 17139]|uniref:TIGR03862 family flavoprotein n=1 Tax=Siccirubricoccus soli TaxID=2899147 RepID=A0ABT1D0H4_9PROT|nr:TIGR03862 family flavoprotein [Siccirubricoccus soli]MCO6415402.1 TIGR03862 family flavoprotein [Siccirubricoccus soli]MCP2681534.1 TIGR03862 family flavoprotein [Siccirubricoccus soli]